MKKKKLVTILALSVFSIAAMADDINYSFSLKDWNHNFKQGSKSDYTNGSVFTATAKKDDYFVTASFLLPTTYSLNGTYLSRRDTDIALGWNANSNFSIIGGYKGVSSFQWNSGTYQGDTIFRIAYAGLSGFTSLNQNSFLYGTLTTSLKADKSNLSSTDSKPKFQNYEFGYGYVPNKYLQLSAGYRVQVFNDGHPGNEKAVLSGVIFGATYTP